MLPLRALISLTDGKQQSGGRLNLQTSKEWRRGCRPPSGLLDQARLTEPRTRDPTSVLAKSHCFPSSFFDDWHPLAHPPSNHWSEFKYILEGGRQTERFRLLYLICLQSHSAGDGYEDVHSFYMSSRREKQRRREPTVPSAADLAPLVPPTTTPLEILRVMRHFICDCVTLASL